MQAKVAAAQAQADAQARRAEQAQAQAEDARQLFSKVHPCPVPAQCYYAVSKHQISLPPCRVHAC